MRIAAPALAAFVVLAACQIGPVAEPSTPAPLPTPTPIPTGTETPSPAPSPTAIATPRPTARPGIQTTAVGTIPESFRYVAIDTEIADGRRTRLWLADLGGRRGATVVAEWEAPAAPVGGWSASADGRSVLISATGTRSRVALHLLRPETGETRVLYEDPGTIVISPRISPDGQRYAYTVYPANGGSDLGIWAAALSGGGPRRIAAASTGTNVPAIPLGWSIDSSWLAFTRDLERTEVHLVPRDGGPDVVVGEGDKVSWRRNPPELLVGTYSAPTSRLYTYDLATAKATDVARADKLFFAAIEWHPALDRFVYVESESAGREASGGIWIRNADGSAPTRLDLGRTVYAPQWSRDGTLLSALAGGDDVRVPVIDLLTGRQLSVLCRRGGTPPADCV